MTRGRPLSRGRRGAAALETAFILPPMLVLLMGIFEVAWYYHHAYAIEGCAARGARAAAAQGSTSLLSTTASSTVSAALDAYGIDGETTTTTLLTGSPQIVKVQVSVPFSSVAGLVPMPASITVVSTAMYEDVNN